jgi:hypothetical protein
VARGGAGPRGRSALRRGAWWRGVKGLGDGGRLLSPPVSFSLPLFISITCRSLLLADLQPAGPCPARVGPYPTTAHGARSSDDWSRSSHYRARSSNDGEPGARSGSLDTTAAGSIGLDGGLNRARWGFFYFLKIIHGGGHPNSPASLNGLTEAGWATTSVMALLTEALRWRQLRLPTSKNQKRPLLLRFLY